MSPGGFRVTALRVKLPCEDEKDFYARFAESVAEKGLRVPTPNLRPIGSKVRVILEFRNAQTVTGEAVVDAHLEGPKPAMNVRLLKFDKPSPAPAATAGAEPTPTPVPTPVPAMAPPAAAPTSKPAPSSAAAAAPPPAATAAPAPAPAPPPETSFESLFADDEETPAEPGARPGSREAARPPAEGTEQLENLWGPVEERKPPPPRAAAPATAPAPEPPPAPGAPEPTPDPARAAPALRRHPAVPTASKRTAIGALVAAVVLGIALVAYSTSRPPAPVRETPAAPVPDAMLAARIANADQRLADGRLTGPDGALDHLLAARALAPEDARVKERLGMLADTLEKLGARAAERGDVAEAEVHLSAALQAAPERQAIAARLESLAKLPRAPARRERPPAAPAPQK